MIRCNCGEPLVKGSANCVSCGTESVAKRGAFWWCILGFVAGFFVPSLFDFIAILYFSEKRVAEEFLNPTLLGRSRWHAARKGIIVGAVTQILLLIALFVLLVLGAYWISNGLGS